MYYINNVNFEQLSNVKDNPHGDSVNFVTMVSLLSVFIMCVISFAN